MDPTIPDKLLDRIAKLMALSEHNSNENEAASAAQKAQDMLLQFNLTAEHVRENSARREASAREPIGHAWYDGHRSATGETEVDWKLRLAFVVARGNLCKVIHFPTTKRLLWIGRTSNREVAQFIYETLIMDLESIAARNWSTVLEMRKYEARTGKSVFPAGYEEWRTIHGRSWKQAFFFGAVAKIKDRLTKSMDDFRSAPDSKALVVNEEGSLTLYYQTTFGGRLGTSAAKNRSLDSAAYAMGQKAAGSLRFRTGLGAGGAAAPRRLSSGS